MQIRTGTVVVRDGNATVKGAWTAGLAKLAHEATMTGLSGALTAGETLVGQSSGSTVEYVSDDGVTLVYYLIGGTPQSGEVFLGGTSGETVTLSNHAERAFDVDETLVFTPSSVAGRVLSWDPATKELRFERTGGLPAANDRVTGLTSGASGQAADPHSTTVFLNGDADTEAVPTGGAFAALFNRRGIATSYEVVGVTADDEMTVSPDYEGEDEDDVPYRVSGDMDAETGLVLINNGDVDIPSLWNRNVARVKQLLGNSLGLFASPPSFAGNARLSTWVKATEDALQLFAPLVRVDPDGANATPQVVEKAVEVRAPSTSRFLRLLRAAGDPDADLGGRLALEAPSADGGADLHAEFGVESGRPVLRVYRDGGAVLLEYDLAEGVLTVDRIAADFGDDVDAAPEAAIRADYDAASRPYQATLSGASGAFTDEEVLDFETSGAVGIVLNEVGSTLVFHLVTGTPQNGETVAGRRSGETATTGGVDALHASAVDADTLTADVNPDYDVDEWVGFELEVLADPGNPDAVGEVQAVTGNSSDAVDVAGWTSGRQPSTQCTWRLRDPDELRDLDPAPYGLAAPVVKDDGNQGVTVAGTTVTQLSLGVGVPGADGDRRFALEGSVGIRNDDAAAQPYEVRVHVGPLGSDADPLVRTFTRTVAIGEIEDVGFHLPLRLAPDDLVTIVVAGDTDGVVLGGAGGSEHLTSSLDVVEVKRRT